MSLQFVRIEPDNLILTSIKKAEDEGGTWIVQWVDVLGEESEAKLTLPGNPKTAMRSNFLEDDGPIVPIALNTLHVPTGKNEVVTVKVRF